ncbi:MAG: ATP-binding cassette domain-containing protein [Actinobacteria bacterium]|nr:ATP-binding cassette domain-containing protein [Actinomycetota bacterium]
MTDTNWGLDRVSVAYDGKQALADVSLALNLGSVVGVAGGDGSGKTTLLRSLLGLVPASSGAVNRPDGDEVGYLPASSGVYPDLTVEENLRFAAGAYGVRGGNYRMARDELLERSGLEDVSDRLGGNLSGGMRQKLGLAMALVHRPRLLVLDEPSTGIDPVSRRELWGLLSEAARDETAVLMTTTYLDEAGRCDTVCVLDDGTVLLQGAPDELVGGFSGVVGETTSRPDTPFAWRRGASWRLWSLDEFESPAVRPVTPDLQDAVIVAALRRRESGVAA